MKHNYKLLIICIVSVITIIVFVVGTKNIYKTNDSSNNELTNFDLSEVDIDKMEKITEEFLNKYLNFSNDDLKSSTWKKKILKYIDNDYVINHKTDELYSRLHDVEWQITHIQNSNTINKLISIDSINYNTDNVSKAYINVSVTQKKNGADVVYSPYFGLIGTYNTTYVIEFNNNYQIISVKRESDKVIKTNWNYSNT